jgi:hypothetical protein
MGNRHTGLYIADDLKAVINDLGPLKVFALVPDNAVNMKAAWSIVEESYPHITPIGCAARALNLLLLRDIMALKTMDTLYKRAKEMVTYVKGHQVIAAIYLTKQSEKNKSTTTVGVVLSSCLTVFWRGSSLSKKWPYHSLPMWTAPARGSSWMIYFGREW